MSGQHQEGGGGEEQLRQSKLEEALEVQSLRRIISAYLDYPDAAEEDVRRCERSFRKLPPAHKALLSHFPRKFKKLRQCISANSYFIFAMLQAFDPPLDMSLDVEHSHQGNLLDNDYVLCKRSRCSVRTASTSGNVRKCDDATCGQKENPESVSTKWTSDTVESDGQRMKDNNLANGSIEGKSSGGFQENLESENHDCAAGSNKNASSSTCGWSDPSLQLRVPLVDVDKVRCIIRNIVRDWAEEGRKERDQCYKPILEELDALFPNRDADRPPSCLVPGAGLGRLALEISSLGFICQGNEFSYYMMICSSFILNNTQEEGEWTIYPWIHSNCNSLSDDDQLRPVSIPDILPASAGITQGFSMCGGDFVEVYGDPSQAGMWDAIVTCFFIDTAHNIMEYIEIISKVLKDGGVWINLGPLLYHFADMYGQDEEMSIELSLEDVKKAALHYGFEFEKERTIQTTYTTNPKSMMQNLYFAAFWTMRKKSSCPS
ncbi:hypothetical protein MLD38_026566 [Melastoma candidum]|uniref:Uncharacterized protein n=1 Tax=Melastoma candidum TaxID=119954 RepID=A0ACB9NZX2_9MYRT|nr:hypothetical protein MLD38_026566 [Melastoma candidum]